MPQTLVWNLNALQQFETAIAFIEQNSPDNAFKIKRNILLKIDQLLLYPGSHPQDKFKLRNDGSFRAFEIYHYRISYYVGKKEIRIIRFRHSSLKPKNY